MPTDFPISRMVGGYFVLCEKSRMKSRMACCRSVRVMASSDDNPNLSQKLPKDNPSFHYSRHKGLIIPSFIQRISQTRWHYKRTIVLCQWAKSNRFSLCASRPVGGQCEAVYCVLRFTQYNETTHPRRFIQCLAPTSIS